MLTKDFLKLAETIPSDHFFDPIFNGDGDGLETLVFRNNESVTFQFGNNDRYTLAEVVDCLKDTPEVELINVDCLTHVEYDGDCWIDVQAH